jgi:hypothetical protein
MIDSSLWNARLRTAAGLTVLAIALVLQAAGCGKGRDNERGTPAMSIDDAIRVMDAHVKELMAIPGVVGVAVGELESGAPCIKVLVAKKIPDHRKRIPKEIEGVPVVIEESGEFRPMSGDSSR